MLTWAPSRAAATAALAPLPPPCWEKRPPLTVSPAAGSRSPTTTRSVLIEPTTITRGRSTRGSLGGPCTAGRRAGRLPAVRNRTDGRSRHAVEIRPGPRHVQGVAEGKRRHSCRFAVEPQPFWRSSCSPSRQRPRSPAARGRVMAIRPRITACARRHGPELLLRHGRPLHQRRPGERPRRPATGQGRRPVRLRPDRQGLVPRRRPEGPDREARLHQGPRDDRDLAHAELQEQGGPATGQLAAGYHGYWITDFTQIDPHFGTNADLRDADRRRAPRAASRSTSTSSPTTPRTSSSTARACGSRTCPRTRRRTGRRRARRSTTATTRAASRSRRWRRPASRTASDGPRQLPLPPVRAGRRAQHQGPGVAQRRDATTTTAATRRSSARTRCTATSSGSTTCSPSTRASSTASSTSTSSGSATSASTASGWTR